MAGKSLNRYINMCDVAQHAGVSQTTVSRVVNNHPGVRPNTRQAVLNTLRTLGYKSEVFNLLEPEMRKSQKVKTVALVLCPLPEQHNPLSLDFFSELLSGVQHWLPKRGYRLEVLTLPYGAEDLPVSLLEEQPVGAILISNPNGELIRNLTKRRIPLIVAAASILPDFAVDKVMSDNLETGRMACRKMLERGIDDFGVIVAEAFHERLLGIEIELFACGKSLRPENRMLVPNTDNSSFIAALQPRIAAHTIPRGLIVQHSDAAMISASLLECAGYRIPDDVELLVLTAGNKNCRFPALREDPREIGIRAAQALLNRIDYPAAQPCIYTLPCVFVEGNS